MKIALLLASLFVVVVHGVKQSNSVDNSNDFNFRDLKGSSKSSKKGGKCGVEEFKVNCEYNGAFEYNYARPTGKKKYRKEVEFPNCPNVGNEDALVWVAGADSDCKYDKATCKNLDPSTLKCIFKVGNKKKCAGDEVDINVNILCC